MKERLQKILASAGVASRREAENLIRMGKVSLNGRVVTEMGVLADVGKDSIVVDGTLLHTEAKRTIMLNKPRGVLTTMHDPEGRPCVADLVKDETVRLFPVGRLDRRSEGLLLLTNDGDLAELLTHPRHGVSKIYQVQASRELDDSALKQLQQGVQLDDGPTLPIHIEALPLKMGYWYKLTISEGRNRQIRRMFEAIGHFVLRLRRVQVGPQRLGDLKPGAKRALTRYELERLRLAAEGVGKERNQGGSPRRTATPHHRRSGSSRTDGGDQRRERGSKGAPARTGRSYR